MREVVRGTTLELDMWCKRFAMTEHEGACAVERMNSLAGLVPMWSPHVCAVYAVITCICHVSITTWVCNAAHLLITVKRSFIVENWDV